MSKKGGIDLDSILDQALDDFEEIELAQNARKVISRGGRQIPINNDHLNVEKSSLNREKNDGVAQVLHILLVGVVSFGGVLL